MRIARYLLPLLLLVAVSSCGKKYAYETVKGDPMETRIYTLDNGLKIYLSVNKDAPRIQTNIAVRVGGKNDPAETTGLAHYFEHLMFKGTQSFGTSDYEAEKPLLDEIEALFEVYRKTTDETERAALYKRIDSISYEASSYFIPNEYDKLMSAIGASGTNAYTSYDVTAYVEDIPANQIENWAKIQSDRFKNPVLRGFHTELETIYEEKNMSLTNDSRKVNEQMLATLYPNHPYGTQTVLGTQEHLKNPSITNVRNYHAQWYVPNNMAVLMSGDFDPDRVVGIIDKYFGDMKPNPELPKLEYKEETPITSPIKREIMGLDAQNITLAWRMGGARDKDSHIADLAGSIIYNGKAGLMDLNLNQQQKVIGAYGYTYAMADYGIVVLQARPKQGQTLDQVRNLLLDEVARLRNGDFDDSLLEASINNYKAQIMSYIDANNGRVQLFVESFINQIPWEETVNYVKMLEGVTKEDIVRWANEYLKDNNYVALYKLEGRDPDEQKIAKPELTPIQTNRDNRSAFLQEIVDSKVKPIEPVFVDYNRDMSQLEAKNDIQVLYKKNETNDIFTLSYIFEIGVANIPHARLMYSYLDYLGTADRSAEDFKREFYNIACNTNVSVQDNRIRINISGLSENMGRAMELVESRIAGAQSDEAVLKSLKDDMMKSRSNSKLNQGANFNALRTYITYGPEYIRNRTLTDKALRDISSKTLLTGVKDLMNYEHTILYYGPLSETEVVAEIDRHHNTPESLLPVPEKREFMTLPTADNKVYLAQYDAAQIYYIQGTNTGRAFNAENDPQITMYNEYFGGGMNSIVFQEMREARGLAYSASAWVNEPVLPNDNYTYIAFIATQNDKMATAIDAFEEIINNMPESEAAFNLAKEAIDARIRTQRVTKANVLWYYLYDKDKGIDYDRNKRIFEALPNMTLQSVADFQKEWVKDQTYTFGILGDIKELDMNKLKSLGEVKRLSKEEIFGY